MNNALLCLGLNQHLIVINNTRPHRGWGCISLEDLRTLYSSSVLMTQLYLPRLWAASQARKGTCPSLTSSHLRLGATKASGERTHSSILNFKSSGRVVCGGGEYT